MKTPQLANRVLGLVLACLVGTQLTPALASDPKCGALAGCFLRNLDFPEEGDVALFPDMVVDETQVYTVGDRDTFSIRCDVVNGTADRVEFLFDDEVRTEFRAPYWMRGDSERWINRVPYLRECPERKMVQVQGFVWGYDSPCFDETYELYAECDGFRISLNLEGVEDETLFTDAADRWGEVITGNLPAFPGFGFEIEPFETCVVPFDIDDVDICGLFQTIDGPGAILAFAFPDFVRIPSFLPINGVMVFDLDDVGTTIAGDDLRSTILHEMGHVLGLGTIWEALGLAGTDAEDCPYNGTQAFREYEAISGCDTGFVPVELEAGVGSRCGHWAEFCFDTELMTPFANIGSFEPLSQITAASLADLGYEITFDHVDLITADDLAPECRCDGRRRRGLTGWRQVSQDKPRRKLQEETEEMARNRALEIMKNRGVDSASLPDNMRCVGDKVIVIYVQEGGVIYDVIVTA